MRGVPVTTRRLLCVVSVVVLQVVAVTVASRPQSVAADESATYGDLRIQGAENSAYHRWATCKVAAKGATVTHLIKVVNTGSQPDHYRLEVSDPALLYSGPNSTTPLPHEPLPYNASVYLTQEIGAGASKIFALKIKMPSSPDSLFFDGPGVELQDRNGARLWSIAACATEAAGSSASTSDLLFKAGNQQQVSGNFGSYAQGFGAYVSGKTLSVGGAPATFTATIKNRSASPKRMPFALTHDGDPCKNIPIVVKDGNVDITSQAVSPPADDPYLTPLIPKGGSRNITIAMRATGPYDLDDVVQEACIVDFWQLWVGETSRVNLFAVVLNGPEPTVNISDAAVTEGDSGTKNATFTVSLAQPSSTAVSVKYATANGSALAPSDYTAKAKTVLTFAAGQSSKTVTIPVRGDIASEPDETFSVVLSDAVGAVIGDAAGTGTISNDDPPVPHLTVDDVTVAEGTGGTTKAIFTLNLSNAASATVSVKVATANGTAIAPSDYTVKLGETVSFSAGQTSKTVPVTISPDQVSEPDEAFSLVLSSPAGLVLDDQQATATIMDDD